MNRQIRSLLLAGFVACCATPVFAAPSGSAEPAEEAAQTTTVAVQRISLPDSGVRDEVAMVLVGTVLIGLAAAVRRAA
jgi:hypothetical protein